MFKSFLQKKDSHKTLLSIVLISILPILALYIPFLFKLDHFFFLKIAEPGFSNILRNWDGPHYIVVARSFYNPEAIIPLLFTDVSPSYYPAHFPLYPLFIRLFSPFLGFFYSGLFVTIMSGILLNYMFYSVAKKYTQHPLLLTAVFTVFPPRFLVTRAILAPEPLMVLCMFLSLVAWENKEYFKGALWGSLGILSKVKAGFLFPAFVASSMEEMFVKKQSFKPSYALAALIPLTLCALFGYFYYQTGDFFAFLVAEKGNSLFVTFPFAQFNHDAVWAQSIWLEDVVFYFAAMILLTVTLFYSKQNRSWFYFSLFYTAFLIFVPQRDITRFSYPLYPLFLLTFEKFFTSKHFKIVLILLLPAIYFYTLNFILHNQAPIANPGQLLGL